MKEYVKRAIEDVPEDIIKNASTPVNHFLFEVRDAVKKFDKARVEIFHSMVAKLLYICKRSHLDIQIAVAFLTTKVSRSDEDDDCRRMYFLHPDVLTTTLKDVMPRLREEWKMGDLRNTH